MPSTESRTQKAETTTPNRQGLFSAFRFLLSGRYFLNSDSTEVSWKTPGWLQNAPS
jgi:hypothetical protein